MNRRNVTICNVGVLAKAGVLSLKIHPALKTIYDIARVFNVPRAAVHKGRGFMFRGGVDISQGVTVWWPRLEPFRPNSGWRNEPIYDSTSNVVEIRERYDLDQVVNRQHIVDVMSSPRVRIVFGKFSDRTPYEYLGVFALDKTASTTCAVWKRVMADVELSKVASIGEDALKGSCEALRKQEAK